MREENDDVVVEPDGSEELGGKGGDAGAKVAKLQVELEKVRGEKQEYLDGWQRAKADYVNALKRFEEEKKGAIEMGKVLTISAFLPVMDSLMRAEVAGEIPESFKGIALQLHTAAHTLSLEKVGEVGEVFNPSIHEALGQDQTDSIEKDNAVSVVLETGWKSKEMVIRPAKVRVFHFND